MINEHDKIFSTLVPYMSFVSVMDPDPDRQGLLL